MLSRPDAVTALAAARTVRSINAVLTDDSPHVPHHGRSA
ncbi:hypothetical protein ACH61_01980 [Rathayibacter tanaceti]|uniref:Uncharacterized protein n=1 Tax=Rathayibacter tanaceti TaxID=1671680 RepID=A0A166HNB5_9MICO|nr:hypothetical protein ACH61_01980 [Rathayibacter tanaceti]